MVNESILLTVSLVLSAFFSSAETALFSISETKIIHLSKENNFFLKLIKKMKDNPHNLLTTILIGNNIVNIGASAIATTIAIDLTQSVRLFASSPGYSIGAATGVMTFLILVFGEIFPKSIATRNNIMIAKFVIVPIYWLSFLFYPVIKFLEFIPLITGKMQKAPTLTEEELMTMVEVVEEEGQIKEEEKELINNIFEFDDISASEIMTPRSDMYAIDVNEVPPLEEIIKTGYSRIPVFEENNDNIIGIANIKDLFTQVLKHNGDFDIRKIMTEPFFVPENKKIDTLLKEFKKRKNHISVLVDEHGGVSGILTLEDVIEEIVGDITDESDKEEKFIEKIKPNQWVVAGKIDIEDINKEIDINIPDTDDYDTFSGYYLEVTGRIPKKNEKIVKDNFEISIKEMDGNRIKSILVKRFDEVAGESA
ncbi:MAG: HlyC/CorC family transporter [Desulfobacterales bacterium]|nr:HlyC/CorC family transporter [Desulfobacterales bacterium]MCP4159993.1 HlyC/CorC family transporter [Deltaproteobacteria bacterium]